MARQRKLSPERKEFINSLLGHYNPRDAKDVQEMLKDLLETHYRECSRPKWTIILVIPSMTIKTKKPQTAVMGSARKQ